MLLVESAGAEMTQMNEFRYVEGEQFEHDKEIAERLADGWVKIDSRGPWAVNGKGFCLTLVGRR